jgi:hypothetical protein
LPLLDRVKYGNENYQNANIELAGSMLFLLLAAKVQYMTSDFGAKSD